MINVNKYPPINPKRIDNVLKKPLKKIEATTAINNVTAEILKQTSEYSLLLNIAWLIAVGAKLRPITTITEPITTGGKALSNQFFPVNLIMSATIA